MCKFDKIMHRKIVVRSNSQLPVLHAKQNIAGVGKSVPWQFLSEPEPLFGGVRIPRKSVGLWRLPSYESLVLHDEVPPGVKAWIVGCGAVRGTVLGEPGVHPSLVSVSMRPTRGNRLQCFGANVTIPQWHL
jgi:hypothetical protein